MSGRLNLSWVNKDKALVPDGTAGYAWVERDDPRVTEVRLLVEVSSVGHSNGTPGDNLLIQGDSYDALYALTRIPEYAEEYRGKVKLVYLDPPFNTGQTFEHYDDGLEHSIWLGMMRERLLLVRELLSPDGSVWVHLDDAEMAYCKVLMDEIFGRANFVDTVIWEKADSPRNSARQFSSDHDYILIYGASQDWVPNKLPRTGASDAIYSNPDNDPRGPWLPGDPYANKPYALGKYEVEGPTGRTFRPPAGRYWRISEDRLRELDEDQRIWWGPNGSARPSIKRFLSEVGDLVPRTLWDRHSVGSNRSSKNEMRKLFSERESFATPKPERLLERVIHIGSNPGDLVLDCFAGSGTTAAVAHKTGRRWVTVELSSLTVDAFTAPRLRQVVAGADAGGITESVGWAGGGGFRQLAVAESVYDTVNGRSFLQDGIGPDRFALYIAAQLGFKLESRGTLSGVRGRMRLAVVDGMLDEQVARSALLDLKDDEMLTIVGRSMLPGMSALLRELRPGSRALKAPDEFFRTASTRKVVR